MILMVGKCIVSCISYPYSSRIFRRNLARSTNTRFGTEFIRSVNRLTDVVDKMSSEGDQEDPISAALISLTDMQNLQSIASENDLTALSAKEIYLRVAQNIELVALYSNINEKIVQ